LFRENGPRIEALFRFCRGEDHFIDEEAHQLLALLGDRVFPDLLEEPQPLPDGAGIDLLPELLAADRLSPGRDL
jgi:hypothetical protein